MYRYTPERGTLLKPLKTKFPLKNPISSGIIYQTQFENDYDNGAALEPNKMSRELSFGVDRRRLNEENPSLKPAFPLSEGIPFVSRFLIPRRITI